MSKRKFFLLLVLVSFPFISFSYAKGKGSTLEAKILDTSGVTHQIQNLTIQKKSFSFLGGGGEGDAETQISVKVGDADVVYPFQHISKIEVKARDKKMAALVLTFKDGTQIKGAVKSSTELTGIQPYASSCKIQFLYIKFIEFQAVQENLPHCSKCKRTFWTEQWKFCPFDGNKLK